MLSNPQLPWIILWLGLAALIIGLIVLTYTSWGQSHPLRKCAAMSLLVHLLLAAYATTVQIVTAGSPTGLADHGPVSVTLVGDDGLPPDAPQSDRPANPWDKLLNGAAPASDVLAVNATPLAKPELLAPAETKPAPKPAEPSKSLLETVAATPAALIKPVESESPVVAASIAPAIKAAAPIDAPTPKSAEPQAANSKPEVSGPERQTVAPSENPHQPHDVATKPVAKPDSLLGAPAALTPISMPAGDSAIAGKGPQLKSSPLAATPIPPVANGSNSGANVASTGAFGGSDANGGKMVAVPPSGRAPSGEPDIYKERNAADRPGVLRRHGGSPETEAAVQAALKWLALHQSPDGHWDAEKYGGGHEDVVLGHDRRGAGAHAHSAVTGLALLALLGSGNTHLDGPYKENVRRGLNYLISIQAADGDLGGGAELYAFMYCHGMATFSMSEAYAMTHDRRLEQPLRRALGYTLATQHPTTGGWRYQPRETGDLSQLGWQLMSLKSADLAGLAMPEQTRDGAVRFIRSVEAGPNGGLASYRPNEAPTRPMTAESLVCRQFMGMTRDNPAANEAGDYLLGELPSKDHVNLYYWYYGTLGMYQLQGVYWERWNTALQAALVGQQAAGGDLAGSWDPKCIWGGYGGRVYSTAMSALCLEVYYRFLPLYNGKPVEAAQSAKPAAIDR
jgi:hypothetical protein